MPLHEELNRKQQAEQAVKNLMENMNSFEDAEGQNTEQTKDDDEGDDRPLVVEDIEDAYFVDEETLKASDESMSDEEKLVS